MMSDIVERLRAHKEARLSIASGLHEHDTPSVCRDAADEITRLRERLKAADNATTALAHMLDDDPSLDEQKAGRTALAAYRALKEGQDD